MASRKRNYLKFSSTETNFVMTLPIGWIRVQKHEESNYPVDFYRLSNNYEYSPNIILQIIPVPKDEHHANSYQELSEVLLNENCQQAVDQTLEVLDQILMTIDVFPSRTDVIKYVDKDTEIHVTQYQTCIQMENAVCGFLATVLTEEQTEYLPIFEQAAKSLSYIKISALVNY